MLIIVFSPVQKSFKRDTYWDWSQYNTLVVRLRGDGRSYLLNLSTEGYFDLLWFDMYHYVLYTRGGPHWQTARVRPSSSGTTDDV